MRRYRTALAAAFSALLLGVACERELTQPERDLTFAVRTPPTIVGTLAEWQAAITTAQPGVTIVVDGVIEVHPGEETDLKAANVTIRGSAPGSGLRGVGRAPDTDRPTRCLICIFSADGQGATIQNLILEGSSSPLETGAPGVTIRDTRIRCDWPSDACQSHVFFAGQAADARILDNVMTGQPSFSAIQIQSGAVGAVVKHNWVERAGPMGGIRIRNLPPGGGLVVDNTIAWARRWAIITNSDGWTYRDNKVLQITGVDPTTGDPLPSCVDDGPGNKWVDNAAPVPSSPVGICAPTN